MEKQANFEALKTELSDEHQPSTPTEAILVNSMAESLWLKQRAEKLQETCIEYITGQTQDAKMFFLYLRYQTTHTRSFHKCLNDLLKLRAENRKSERGFEAQKNKEEELRIKNEQHEMKKQSHYWNVLHKDAKACHQLTMTSCNNPRPAKKTPGSKPNTRLNWQNTMPNPALGGAPKPPPKTRPAIPTPVVCLYS